MGIADTVNTIHEMFRDIQIMINDQGRDLDRIEMNIEQTVDHTHKAKEEIKEANVYQKLTRNKFCWIFLMLIIIITIFIIIIVVTTTKQ